MTGLGGALRASLLCLVACGPFDQVGDEAGSGPTTGQAETMSESATSTTGPGGSGSTSSADSTASDTGSSTGTSTTGSPECLITDEGCFCDGEPSPLEACLCVPYVEDGACWCDLPLVGQYELDPSYCRPLCTQASPYRSCDPACPMPCDEGLVCAGPDGFEACTMPCMDAEVCPPTEFAAPWDVPVCDLVLGVCGFLCAVPECPNPGVYSCQPSGTCWPQLP